jgi:glycosyltransferase involved in cell wall biosynthesis
MKAQLQWVGPMPPLRTGIANYNLDLLNAVDGRWQIAVVLEGGSNLGDYNSIRRIAAKDLDYGKPTIVHVGNSEFHDVAYSIATSSPTVVVLHDVFLHHARASLALRSGRMRQYWRELQIEYGAAGVAAGRALLAGTLDNGSDDYPMFERLVRAARVTVVHSDYAAEMIRRRIPDATVRVVPMGIPIPARIPKLAARRNLGLSDSAFIIGSITHVNPNKRISVVLRAMRRIVENVPHAVLLLAGTGSDGDLMTREIEVLGLQRHVRQYGYVDDWNARVLASALDACVNLRFPTAGETSASLLRLLGAGLPVLITDVGASGQLPDGIGLTIPVNENEVEMIAEVLRELARNVQLRDDAGQAAFDHVLRNNSMINMIDGYRDVIQEAYDVRLPGLSEIPRESSIVLPDRLERERVPNPMIQSAAQAMLDLGLVNEPVALNAVGAAIAELGLDRSVAVPGGHPSSRVMERIACLRCGSKIDETGHCQVCGAAVESTGKVINLR